MSFEALNWAFSQTSPSSTAKFVLVALANFANESFESYPSVSKISEMTNMDRKTIISGLDKLADLKLISDTGKRVGNTHQIKVYKLNSPVLGTVPDFPSNSPVFPTEESRFSLKESQKRDTDPSVTKGTVIEPTRVSSMRRPRNIEEVIHKGAIVGVSEDVCRKWFIDCEACGWMRGDGTPFDNWPRQLCIHRDKLREQTARALPPPNGHGQKRPMFVSELRTMIQAKEERIAGLRREYAREDDGQFLWPKSAALQKQECITLEGELSQLKIKLASMTV